MRSRHKILVLSVFILLIFAAGYIYSPKNNLVDKPVFNQQTGGYLADAEVTNLRKSIAFYEHKIRTEPDAVKNYAKLATLKMQQTRLVGNHHESYPEIQQLLDKVLNREPGNFEAILTQATLYLNYHQFEKAKTWAENAIEINAGNALAWGIYSDSLKELGEYDKAISACDKMLSLRPDLRSYSRAAHLRELHGDLTGAKSAMRLAVNAGVIGFESHAWAVYQLGNLYLKEGKIDSAANFFNAILELNPNYAMAYKGLGEVAIEKGHYGQALNHLHKAYKISPLHEFSEILAKIYRLSGERQKAKKLTNYILEEFAMHEAQGWNVNLEYAKFCLENEIISDELKKRISEEMKNRPNNKEVIAVHEQLFSTN